MSNKALIQQYFDAVAGKIDKPMGDFLADDIEWTLPPAHPFGGPFKGQAQVLEMMGRGSELFLFETITVNVHVLMADGDNVAAHFELRAKTPDGRDYFNQYMFRFQCRNGEIVAVWEFLDTYYQSTLGFFDQGSN